MVQNGVISEGFAGKACRRARELLPQPATHEAAFASTLTRDPQDAAARETAATSPRGEERPRCVY